MLLYVIVLGFITRLGAFRFSDRVRVKETHTGMCCADRIIKKGKKYVIATKPGRFLKLNYISLSPRDVQLLKKLYSNGELDFDEVTIMHTMPLAPFMFYAVLMTFVIRSDLITFLRVVAVQSRHIF
jgi:hypothetical protein